MQGEAEHELTLKALATFIAVAHARSVSGAAAQLGLAQSAISRQISMLEKTFGGALFYLVASAIEHRGTNVMSTAGRLLLVIAPFSMLEPVAAIAERQEYHTNFNWIYLVLAIGIALLSHRRQRKSFYYAGVINSVFALYLIADRYEWFDDPLWSVTLVVIGLVVLVTGFLLDRKRQT